MMDKFKDMAKLLAAIEGGQNGEVFNEACVSEEALDMTEQQRDDAALLLYQNDYIDGLRIIDGIDGQRKPHIMWSFSYPTITLKGYEFIDESQPLKRAFKALHEVEVSAAAQIIANHIGKFAK